MNFIKTIFENKPSEEAHRQLSRFSKGTFENKALLDITNSKSIKIKTSSEFANELVSFLSNTITNKTKVTGIIFSTKDLSKTTKIKFEEIKNAMGVKKHVINSELTKEDLLLICKECADAAIHISFKTDKGELKIKEKAPKSGKPGKKDDEEPKADFCVLTTTDKSILQDYAFDVKDNFKKAFIKHTYEISELIVPKEYQNDFALARKYAKRKGNLKRIINLDGEQIIKEKEFVA